MSQSSPVLHTTLGAITDLEGFVLPHEHIFTDLGPIEAASYTKADPDKVVKKMTPYLEAACNAGVGALVECTPVGVGRRVDIVKAVSQAAGLPVVVATGIYREPWIPDWAYSASVEELRDWMIKELQEGVGDTGVRAGFIKLSAGDDGLTPAEVKILRAAAQAGLQTGAVIGSHTIRGLVVLDQLRIIEDEGYIPDRFIWIHTQAEANYEYHFRVAERGAWLEYDGISYEPDEAYIERIQRVLDAGYRNVMLSQDRGWYDPSKPGGGDPAGYTYLSEQFLPKLRQSGVDEGMIATLTRENPIRAFSR
jgi:phosphotriesterase-related protein